MTFLNILTHLRDRCHKNLSVHITIRAQKNPEGSKHLYMDLGFCFCFLYSILDPLFSKNSYYEEYFHGWTLPKKLVGWWCHISTTSYCHTLGPETRVNPLGPKFAQRMGSLNFGLLLVLDSSVLSPYLKLNMSPKRPPSTFSYGESVFILFLEFRPMIYASR